MNSLQMGVDNDKESRIKQFSPLWREAKLAVPRYELKIQYHGCFNNSFFIFILQNFYKRHLSLTDALILAIRLNVEQANVHAKQQKSLDGYRNKRQSNIYLLTFLYCA